MAAQLMTRVGTNDFSRTSLFETVIDPLANAHRPSTFVF
jgi:hypothetical protein